MGVGLAGGVDDEGNGIPLQGDDVAEVEDDVEVALVVDEIAQDPVDARPVVDFDLAVDGDDDGSPDPADVEARCRAQGPEVFASACRGTPFVRGSVRPAVA